jgi:hypothetical protein
MTSARRSSDRTSGHACGHSIHTRRSISSIIDASPFSIPTATPRPMVAFYSHGLRHAQFGSACIDYEEITPLLANSREVTAGGDTSIGRADCLAAS